MLWEGISFLLGMLILELWKFTTWTNLESKLKPTQRKVAEIKKEKDAKGRCGGGGGGAKRMMENEIERMRKNLTF